MVPSLVMLQSEIVNFWWFWKIWTRRKGWQNNQTPKWSLCQLPSYDGLFSSAIIQTLKRKAWKFQFSIFLIKSNMYVVPVSVISMGSCIGISGRDRSDLAVLLNVRRGRLIPSSLECEVMWLFLWAVVLNFLSQWGQSNGLAPVNRGMMCVYTTYGRFYTTVQPQY